MTIEQTVAWVINNFEGHLFTNDPIDTGGATKFGITLKTLQYYRRIMSGNPNLIITKNDVANLTFDEAVRIGIYIFANESGINKISSWDLRLVAYDYQFHSGNRSVKDLQFLVGVKRDGVIGPVTLKAIKDFNDDFLLTIQLLTLRENFMQDLMIGKPSQRKYMFGWWIRTTKLQHVISRLR